MKKFSISSIKIIWILCLLIFLCSCINKQKIKIFCADIEKRVEKKDKPIIVSRWINKIRPNSDYLDMKKYNYVLEGSKSVIFDNKIFIGFSNHKFCAFNFDNGELVWEFIAEGGIESEASISDGLIYFGDIEGNVYALDIQTGRQVWSYKIDGSIFVKVAFYEDLLFVVSSKDILVGLNKKDGSWVWHYKGGQRIAIKTVKGNSSPIVVDGIIYIGFSDGNFSALNAVSGVEKWGRILENGLKFNDVDSTPVIDEDSIYISSFGGSLYSLDKEKGYIKWRRPEAKGVSRPVINGNFLYYSGLNRKILCLLKQDGNIIWEYQYPDKRHGLLTTPVIVGEYLFAG